MRTLIALLCLAVCGAVSSQEAATAQAESTRLVRPLPAIEVPPLPDAPVDVVAPLAAARGGKLSPPAPMACATADEMARARAGRGCDCSCAAYAKGPGRTCQLACATAYYACWAPEPSQAEFDRMLEQTYGRTPVLAQVRSQPELLSSVRGGWLMSRAAPYAESLVCK